ncbi:MAG: nucleotidyltransferase family protein [Thermodesulfobacteriota bacterium]
MTLPVAILAGGLATRLRPVTERIPKALIDIEGRPFIEHQLELLKAQGFTRVVLCVSYLGEMIEDALGDGSRFGVEIKYVFDGGKLLGTGGALRKALPHLGEAFMILYGDSYLDCDYKAVADAFIKEGKQGLMTVFRNEGKWDTSNVEFSDGCIIKYDKKDLTPEMHYIDYGLGVLKASVLEEYPEDTVFDLAGVYGKLVAHGELSGFEIRERFYEIGTPESLEETREYILQRG